MRGDRPFTQLDVLPVLLAHVSGPPPPLMQLRPDGPMELAVVIDRMLAKSPAARWPSVGEAILAANAAPYVFDPAVRAALRDLANEGTAGLPPMVSTPLSPLPEVRTVMITPRSNPIQRPVRSARGPVVPSAEYRIPGTANESKAW